MLECQFDFSVEYQYYFGTSTIFVLTLLLFRLYLSASTAFVLPLICCQRYKHYGTALGKT